MDYIEALKEILCTKYRVDDSEIRSIIEWVLTKTPDINDVGNQQLRPETTAGFLLSAYRKEQQKEDEHTTQRQVTASEPAPNTPDAPVPIPDADTLLHVLKKHWYTDFKSTQLAEGFKCPGKFREIGKVLGELSRSGTGICFWKVKGKDFLVWKYSPDRIRYKAAKNPLEVLADLICSYLAHVDNQSLPNQTRTKSAIRKAVRRRIGAVQNDSIDRALDLLTDAGKITTEEGKKGRHTATHFWLS